MDESLFKFSWENNTGLDLNIVNWEDRVLNGKYHDTKLLSIISELSGALYSAHSELRTIYRILGTQNPEAYGFQYQFEFSSHMHFLSVAVNRVIKIMDIGFPVQSNIIRNKNEELINQISNFRNSIEHQTEIGQKKDSPNFFNNFSDSAYESSDKNSHQKILLRYKDIEHLLNEIMAELEPKITSSGIQ